MDLLEYKKHSGIRVSNNQDIVSQEFKRLKEQAEYYRIMNISEFINKRRIWMKMNCKRTMSNTKDQGYSQVDWKGLTLSKHRR